MLTSVYYSETRDKICLVSYDANGRLTLASLNNVTQTEGSVQFLEPDLLERFLSLHYELIGYYNEDI